MADFMQVLNAGTDFVVIAIGWVLMRHEVAIARLQGANNGDGS